MECNFDYYQWNQYSMQVANWQCNTVGILFRGGMTVTVYSCPEALKLRLLW